MSENTKNLITWLIVLAMVVVTCSALFFTMPNFVGVERVVYTQETTVATTKATQHTTIPPTTTAAKVMTKATTIVVTTIPNSTTVKTDAVIADPVFPINLNTATAEQLMLINGIGETYATRIVEYREEIGGYTSLDQLLSVKGIGEKRLAAWRQYLTI